MQKNPWRKKSILITGYEGFLGSWLTRFLLERGARIIGLDILTHRRKTVLTPDELRRMTVVRGSVENAALVKKLLAKRRIEFVFHLAARALVADCQRKPAQAFSTNIRGTWNVLEACRLTPGVQGIIVASSDKAYGSHQRLPYTEDFCLKGDHPYDASKSCADLLACAYFHSYKLPVCVTRCGNIYGPGDFNFSRIIPDAMRCALQGKTLCIRSDGKFVRDYVYVKDIALAYILLGEKMLARGIAGESFNFSAEKPLTVLQVVRAVSRACGKDASYAILDQAQYEIRKQYLSSAKARRLLGWRPRYSFAQGLKESAAWYTELLRRKR